VSLCTCAPDHLTAAAIPKVALRLDAARSMLEPMKGPRMSIASAFTERDASYAVRLMSTSSDAEIRYTLRRVVGEDGEIQMFVLEATFRSPALAERVETAMEGAHGIVVPSEVLALARAG
jgi:hypothetical protein